MLASRPASQVVNCVSCQPTEAREVDDVDSVRPAIFSFFAKLRKLGAAVLVASSCSA